MKKPIIIALTLLTFASCGTNKEKQQNIVTIDPNQVVPNGIVHDSLSTDQIEKIKIIQSTFFEVLPISLEETIDNFKKDQNPDSEIAIWLDMCDAYEKYISKHSNLTLDRKKEVYKLILSRSMMPEDEAIINAELKILTEKEAREVLSYYTAPPDPLDVVTK